jgi:hypothetical protein
MASAAVFGSGTQLDAVFKELYDAKGPENVANRAHVFLSQVPKKDDFYGDVWKLPVTHGNPQGRAQHFATAQGSASAAARKAFMITHAKDYGYTTIDRLTIKASKNNRGAFLKVLEDEGDGVLDQLGNSLGQKLYGNGNAFIGQCSNNPTDAGGPITLTNADDAKNFSIGQRIVVAASTDPDGDTIRSGIGTVSAVDEDAGSITFTGTITGITTNDYIFTYGDDVATLGSSAGRIYGLNGWLPLTAPTSGDSFWGVDRSVDTIRLSGNRLDTPTAPAKEIFLYLADRIFRHRGKADRGYINPTHWTTLVKDLGVKIDYEGGGGTADYGFETVRIHGAGGPLKIYADPDCPINRVFALQLDTWEFKHLDGVPHWFADDGGRLLRQASDDGYELRAGYYGNLGCRAPAWNGVGSIQ